MIHRTALVEDGAELAPDVEIGPFTVVHANVRIGGGTHVGSHCVLGEPTPLGDGSPLVIDAGSMIRSHSTFYEGSSFGPGLLTGHGVTVREGTRAGAGLRLGTLCDIQGDLIFGEHVRLHSNVHCGKLARVGDYVWLFPYVVLTNDPTPPSDLTTGVEVGDCAVIATMSTVLPGVRVGERALVGAQSLVSRDVPPDTVVAGVPAQPRGPTDRVQLRDGSGPAYPWMRHFHRDYPEDVVVEWKRRYA